MRIESRCTHRRVPRRSMLLVGDDGDADDVGGSLFS